MFEQNFQSLSDKQDGHNKQRQTRDEYLADSPNDSIPESVATGNNAVRSTGGRAASKNDKNNSADEFKRFEFWQLIINGLAVVVGAAVCLIYGCQLSVMQQQLTEMKGSGTQTQQLIAQATAQANAAKAQSEQAKAQTEEMGKSLKKTDDLINATIELGTQSKRSADASVVGSKASQQIVATSRSNLELAERSLFVQQRPWVGLNSMNGSVQMEKPLITATANFHNFGRSPAFNVVMTSACIFDRTPQVIFEGTYILKQAGSESMMMPDSGKSTDGMTCDIRLSPSQFHSIEDGTKNLYIFGIVSYKDAIKSGGEHVTRFCGVWNPTNKSFDDCNTYNSAD